MTATAEVAAPAATPADTRPARWPAWALAAICAVAGALYAWRIGAGQVGNSYYAAAAKSMSTSFTNFLFGSFDPAGVVTVDKPPMALWPQAVSVWLFGFHGWAVLLPQVVEGVAAVFLLHRTVRRWAGEHVALLAALIFALTPVTVAINRDNNPDTLLVLTLVAAAYALTRSVQAGESRVRTTWLLWCAFFIGCGFLTKMLQAWIVVPGFALAYLVATGSPLKRRVADLLGAGVVLVVSSFWWVALHAFWPGSKPYIGGSTDGGAWDLIIGYNGLGRVFGGSGNRGGGGERMIGTPPAGVEVAGPGGGAMFGGQAGVTRMFDNAVGGQISWLLPLSLLVLVAVAAGGVLRRRREVPGDAAERAGWFLWGSWLLVTMAVFSFAQGIFHPYYTTMLAPAVAAISAAGLVMFWRARSVVRFLLPVSVVLTAAWAFVVVSRDTSWHGWARWAVVGVAAVAVVVLLAGLRRTGLVAAVVAVLLVPAVWSTATAATATDNGVMPAAGPADGGGQFFRDGPVPGGQAPGQLPGGQTPGQMPPNGTRQAPDGRADRGQQMRGPGPGSRELTEEQRKILAYAKENSGGAAITLAVAGSAQAAAPFIMGSDEVVIGMGGFSGSDDAPSVDQLQAWVSGGRLKFVLGNGGGMGMRGPGGTDNGRQEWITQHCSAVDPSLYGGSSAQTLLECKA
ncbi:glycosyltransferase family 39 protein [Lentzea sp. NPDC042327]|uniref:ArnT family glycosyltransferase n=1 Tax=Lentzea sp. NPDC042327 TaxID=3154801 RepID=UPI0033EB03F9